MRHGAALLVLLALVAAGCGAGPGDLAEAPAPGLDPDAPAAPAATDAPSQDDTTDGDPLAAGAGTTATPPPPAVTAAPVAPGSPEAVLAGLTLEQKVGQVFSVAVLGDDATDVSAAAAAGNTALFGVPTPAEVVQRYQLGGVAYFAHQQGEGTSNVADPAATGRLSAGLQQAAAASSGVGLLIGADQEGGPVVRLRAPATSFPAARDIAATGDLDLARQVGQVTGTETAAVGVNWVYAPIADVNADPANPVIGERAFGTTAEETTPWVVATAEGLWAGGALPTLKHFPGHGDTSTDSHDSLPTIDHTAAELAAVDFPPFAAGITASEAAGTAMTVMVGHLAVPAIDPSGRPATLSAPILDLLRADPAAGGLGFDGLVVTDAMNMGALQGYGDAGTLAVEAILAGVDVVLMPTDLPAAWQAVLAAAQDGTIPMARLDQAVLRVLQAKSAVGVLDPSGIPAPDPGVLGSPAHQAVADAVRAACAC